MPFMITLDDPTAGMPFCEPFAIPGIYELSEVLIRYGNLGLYDRQRFLKDLQRDKIAEVTFPEDDARGRLNITAMELTRVDIIEMNVAEFAKYGMKFGRL